MTSPRDDFASTVRAAATGQLSDGQVATITRAADARVAAALADFADRLYGMAYDVAAAPPRGFRGFLRASLTAAAYQRAGDMARASAGERQADPVTTAAGWTEGDWLEARTNGHIPAHRREPMDGRRKPG